MLIYIIGLVRTKSILDPPYIIAVIVNRGFYLLIWVVVFIFEYLYFVSLCTGMNSS